jgi:hypothetical protein
VAGVCAQDAIALLVVLLQVAFDGAENFRIVIDGQNDWLLHLNFSKPIQPVEPLES